MNLNLPTLNQNPKVNQPNATQTIRTKLTIQGITCVQNLLYIKHSFISSIQGLVYHAGLNPTFID
jgi:hypothetical protein